MTQFSILCVHPNVELYGSDRMFIETVRALRLRWPDLRISVALPHEGPIVAELAPLVNDILYEPLLVLRRSDLSAGLLLRWPALLRRIARARALQRRHDLVYISTVVTVDHILATRLSRTPALIHIHELPQGASCLIFSGLLIAARAGLVHVSEAVRRSFVGIAGKTQRVIPNGSLAPAWGGTPLVVAGDTNRFRLLLIGRFNRWKGQLLLLEALTRLDERLLSQLRVRLVGGVYGNQVHFETTIRKQIDELGLGMTVEIHPFTTDPEIHYRWANAVVVPSTLPEPFGLVAIEAMARQRPVIAAGHGGLAEIVEDGRTGCLFAPGEADALAAAIRTCMENPDRVRRMGEAAEAQFLLEYDITIYRKRIIGVFERMMPLPQSVLTVDRD